MKRWFAILPLLLLAAFVAMNFQTLTGGNPAPASFASPVRPAPQFDVPGLDGGRMTLADFKGRPVLVNFWGSYCGPCKLEHPLLMKLASEGVEIAGVLYKDHWLDDAREILARDGNPFKALGLDDSGDLGIDFGLSGVPESFLIDATGRIVKTKRNYLVEADVPAFIAAYRAELAKAAPAT